MTFLRPKRHRDRELERERPSYAEGDWKDSADTRPPGVSTKSGRVSARQTVLEDSEDSEDSFWQVRGVRARVARRRPPGRRARPGARRQPAPRPRSGTRGHPPRGVPGSVPGFRKRLRRSSLVRGLRGLRGHFLASSEVPVSPARRRARLVQLVLFVRTAC